MLFVILGLVFLMVLVISVWLFWKSYQFGINKQNLRADLNKCFEVVLPGVATQLAIVAIGWTFLLYRGLVGWFNISFLWLVGLIVLITGTAIVSNQMARELLYKKRYTASEVGNTIIASLIGGFLPYILFALGILTLTTLVYVSTAR